MLEHKEVLSSLRKALVHIDDPAYLEGLPYLEQIIPGAGSQKLSRGQVIQRALRVAIDGLAPGAEQASPLDALTYEALYQYTLSHRNMSGIALRLGMSDRQAYRLLNRAIDALATELLHVHGDSWSVDADEQTLMQSSEERVRLELERLLELDTQLVDMIELLKQVRMDIAPLAKDLDVPIEMQLGHGALIVTANRVLLRQALLNLASHILSCTTPGLPIQIMAERAPNRAQLRFVFRRRLPDSDCAPQSPLRIAEQILELVHIPHSRHVTEEGLHEVVLDLPTIADGAVLIVDDNEDLIVLFERYLKDQPFRVYGASSYAQARQMVAKHEPDAIILDIMLPQRDGWELLRTLRDTDPSYRPKVIVCSIINDPELSSSLGADAFLNKPVSKRQLIDTLYTVRSALT